MVCSELPPPARMRFKSELLEPLANRISSAPEPTAASVIASANSEGPKFATAITCERAVTPSFTCIGNT